MNKKELPEKIDKQVEGMISVLCTVGQPIAIASNYIGGSIEHTIKKLWKKWKRR